MLSLVESPLRIVRVLQKLSGYTQSNLVLCDDARLYVVKLHPHPLSGNSLANEIIGAIVSQYLDIPVPCWRFVSVTEGDLARFPDLRFTIKSSRVDPKPGTHFASRYLADPDHIIADAVIQHNRTPVLNVMKFLDMYLFDVWANHRDRRQYIIRTERQSGLGKVFFIDNSHLFGNVAWEGPRDYEQPDSNVWTKPLTGGYDNRLARRVREFQRRIPEVLPLAMAHTPSEWHRSNIVALRELLMWRLDNLRELVKTNMRFHGVC